MSRDWARLRLTVSNSFVDWVCAEVVEWGSPGVEVHESEEGRGKGRSEQVTLDIYFPEKKAADAHRRLGDFLERLGPQAVPYSLDGPQQAPQLDWAERWQYHFPPIPIGERLLILPPWEQIQPGQERSVIYLQPGMAFGTGHHPTTALILESLEALQELEGLDTVLDVGCGSAILAIGAVRLGARRVLAVDYDKDAVQASKSNVDRNQLSDRIMVAQARFPSLPASGPFKLILANLYFTFFEENIEELGTVTAPGGVALISGLREEEMEAAASLVHRAGMETRACNSQGGWIMLEAVRP